MVLTDFSEIIQQISDFGNEVFSKTVGILNELPGTAAGLASVVLILLAAVGTFTLLKKSFKFFGIILLIVLVAIIALSFFK